MDEDSKNEYEQITRKYINESGVELSSLPVSLLQFAEMNLNRGCANEVNFLAGSIFGHITALHEDA